MVIFLQLCIFLTAVTIRGRFLFGAHLKKSSSQPDGLTYIVTSKNGISARHIGITQPSGIPFIIKREKWYHRILKSLGIASEIRVTSDEFDKTYFITTDYPNHLEQTLASGKLLTHLQALFALPVKSLHATPRKMWCVIRKDDLQASDSHYAQHFALLAEISKTSSISSGYEVASSTSRRLSVTAFIFISIHAGLLTMGLLGAFPTLADSVDMVDAGAWIAKGILLGILLAIVWFFAILHMFRGSSWVCWVLADFVLCGVLGFILSGVFVVREANTHLPQPPAQVFTQPILQKVCVLECKKRCGRRCTRRSSYRFQSDATCSPESRYAIMQEKKQTDYICANSAWYEYTLHVQHWREPSDYSFSPSEALFDNVRTGTMLNVPVNEGALGLEWIDTDEIQAR